VRRTYHDGADLLRTFDALTSEVQRILSAVEPVAFWNNRRPKAEPHAGWALRTLFEALCPLKNLRIYQENPSRSGRVDYVFSAISADHAHLELVMELKHAHSDRLRPGLTDQLPTYLRERTHAAAAFGILWYKGRHFDRPRAYASLDECIAHLESVRPAEVDGSAASTWPSGLPLREWGPGQPPEEELASDSAQE
jgi:hypothetical protein